MNDRIDMKATPGNGKERSGAPWRDFPEWILSLVLFAGVVFALIEGAMSLNAGTIV
jgi:hypothetical protein